MTRLIAFSFAGLLLALPAPLLAQDEQFDEEAPHDAEEEELSPTEAIEQALEVQTISLQFDETPFDEVLDFLRDITGLNLVVDSRLDTSELAVSLRLEGISLKNALKLILACDESLAMTVWSDVIYVHAADAKLPEPTDPGPSELGRTVASRTLTLNFDGTPLEEVVGFMRDLNGLDFVISAGARERVEEAQVSLRVRGIALSRVLDLVTVSHGLRWSVADEVIKLEPR